MSVPAGGLFALFSVRACKRTCTLTHMPAGGADAARLELQHDYNHAGTCVCMRVCHMFHFSACVLEPHKTHTHAYIRTRVGTYVCIHKAYIHTYVCMRVCWSHTRQHDHDHAGTHIGGCVRLCRVVHVCACACVCVCVCAVVQLCMYM